MQDCIFCKLGTGEVPTSKVYEDDFTIVFKNIEPVAETHLLVCPKEHITSFMEIDTNSFNMSCMVKAVQEAIKKLKLESGYKLIFNGGKYVSIPHLHWHILSGKLEDKSDILNQL